jgi:hypothetical protein
MMERNCQDESRRYLYPSRQQMMTDDWYENKLYSHWQEWCEMAAQGGLTDADFNGYLICGWA